MLIGDDNMSIDPISLDVQMFNWEMMERWNSR